MTYPAPQYPPQQAPAWPPAPQPQYGQPVYAPQPQYGAPQGFGQPPMQPAPPPLANGTLDDFYNQPSTGGQFIKWGDYPGKTVAGVIARNITNADIRQITSIPSQGSKPQFYNDGRPKLEMLVPIRVAPSQENPEGILVWPVKGADRDELARAMSEAGVTDPTPQKDAFVQITFTELRPTRGGIPQKVKRVHYTVPGGQAVAANHQIVQPMQYAQPAPQQQYAQTAPQPQYAQPQQVQQLPPGYAFVDQGGLQVAQPGQPVPPAQGEVQYVGPPAQPAPAPQAAPAPAAQPAQQLAMPADFSPEQQALMARLTGQQG